jgi:hypothetical protein
MTMTIHRPATTRNQLMRLFAGSALLAMCAGQAAAEDTKLTQQPFQISLGSFTNASEIKIRADGENLEDGTEFNWGDTLGDVEGTTFRLDSYWRINDRHHIRFMYTENSSNRAKTLDRDIEWNGQLIPVDASVKSEFGFYVVEVAYEYDFSKREDRELVLSAGLHYTAFSTKLTGTYNTQGGGGTTTVGSEAKLGAPLPVIGARGMWNLGGNWWLDGQVQYFQVAIDNIDGSILNYRAAVIWQPKQWLGFGVGYDSFGIDVDATGKGDRLKGKLEWTYQGPQAFFNFAF